MTNSKPGFIQLLLFALVGVLAIVVVSYFLIKQKPTTNTNYQSPSPTSSVSNSGTPTPTPTVDSNLNNIDSSLNSLNTTEIDTGLKRLDQDNTF